MRRNVMMVERLGVIKYNSQTWKETRLLVIVSLHGE